MLGYRYSEGLISEFIPNRYCMACLAKFSGSDRGSMLCSALQSVVHRYRVAQVK